MTAPPPSDGDLADGREQLAAAEEKVRVIVEKAPGGFLDLFLVEYDRRAVENGRLRSFLLEATGTLPTYGIANDELGDPWVRWLERVAAYLTEACSCSPPPHTDGPEIDCPVHGLPPTALHYVDLYQGARADLAAARDRIAALEAVAGAAQKVVTDWSDSDLDDNSDHPLWNRLDALAAAVRALGPEVEG